jgi:RNA polymerase sigma-70 factor, ECF subfamily
VSVETLKARRFEKIMIPYLDSAYNLARWITRSDADAQDVVQESFLRAFKYFDGFAGEYPNAWLLSIVRNTCYTWIKSHRPDEAVIPIDSDPHVVDGDPNAMYENAQGLGRDPETLLIESERRRRLDDMIAQLPVAYREVIILRELEEMSYIEIAQVLAVPIGTVMSRLARARQSLQASWRKREGREH